MIDLNGITIRSEDSRNRCYVGIMILTVGRVGTPSMCVSNDLIQGKTHPCAGRRMNLTDQSQRLKVGTERAMNMLHYIFLLTTAPIRVEVIYSFDIITVHYQ